MFSKIRNSQVRVFIIIFFIKVNISSNLLIYKMFDIEVIYLYVLFFKVLINFPGTAGVPSSALDTFLYHFLLIMISMVC